MLLRSSYQVIVNGQDVTSRFNPHLLDLSVSLHSKQSSHTCAVTLHDKNGTIALPPDEADIAVLLGRVTPSLVFMGTVNNVTSSGSKGSGRRLTIDARSADQKGKAKEPQLDNVDDATFADAAKRFGGNAGFDVTVIGDLASIQREWWGIEHESFQSWGQRLGRELGATFLIEGKRAMFAPRNEGISASGRPLKPVSAIVGANVLSWSISPFMARPQVKKTRGRWYDHKKADWQIEEDDVADGAGEVRSMGRYSEADQTNTKDRNRASGKESERERGQGTVEIVGEASAQPEARCLVFGARPGIDGSYVIETVTHSLSKSKGFRTSLSLKHPSGGAGTDSR